MRRRSQYDYDYEYNFRRIERQGGWIHKAAFCIIAGAVAMLLAHVIYTAVVGFN